LRATVTPAEHAAADRHRSLTLAWLTTAQPIVLAR
jgi:hypothetical protein